MLNVITRNSVWTWNDSGVLTRNGVHLGLAKVPPLIRGESFTVEVLSLKAGRPELGSWTSSRVVDWSTGLGRWDDA